jgi:hypothetical protein
MTSQLFPADLQKGTDIWLRVTCDLNFCIEASNPYISRGCGTKLRCQRTKNAGYHGKERVNKI